MSGGTLYKPSLGYRFGYRFRVGPYRFHSNGNPTTLSILLWSCLILSDAHMPWSDKIITSKHNFQTNSRKNPQNPNFFQSHSLQTNPKKHSTETSKQRRRSIHMAGLNLDNFLSLGDKLAQGGEKRPTKTPRKWLVFVLYLWFFSVWTFKVYAVPFFVWLLKILWFDTFSFERRSIKWMIYQKDQTHKCPNFCGSISCQLPSWLSQFDDSHFQNSNNE